MYICVIAFQGLNFPEDCQVLTAGEPAQLYKDACHRIIKDLMKNFHQDDNDSLLYSSDRV